VCAAHAGHTQCVNLKAGSVVCEQRFSAHSLVRMRTENHTQIRFKTYTNVSCYFNCKTKYERQMIICKKCKSEINGNFCSSCGQPTRVKRINGQYILQEIGCVFNLQKGILVTIKELLLRPGQCVREFISEDRNRLVKPIVFVIICSLIYTIATRLFHFQDGYIYSSDDKETTQTLIFSWIQSNYGYANILIAIFISMWIKIFFKKYKYNLFEILILLCFVMGMMMLIFSVFGIVEGLTKLNLMKYSGMIGFGYCIWAIGQFFDKTKKINYLKAFFSYFLGWITFVLLILGLAYLIDKM
jgi:hypothetical protein